MPKIDELEAGPELDALVDEKIFGREYIRGYGALPYSTDIAAAWEVVEKLKELDWALEVSVTNKLPEGDSETYYCGLLRGDDNAPWREDFRHIQAWAATAPLAICHAALEAVKDNG